METEQQEVFQRPVEVKKTSSLLSRNSTIELLRIFAMFIIIAHHYYVHSAWPSHSLEIQNFNTQVWFLLTFGNLGKQACSIFFVITGFYMIDKKVNFKKVFLQFASMMFYSWIFMAIFFGSGYFKPDSTGILHNLFPFHYAENWFVVTYIGLMLFIPFVNLGLNQMNQKSFRMLAIVFIFMCTLITLFDGYNNFKSNISIYLCGYVVGAYFGKFQDKISKKIPWLLIGLAFFAIQIILPSFCLVVGHSKNDVNLYNSYWQWSVLDSFYGLMTAVGLVNFAARHPFHSKVINFMSSGIIGVYLIHDNTLFRQYIWLYLYPNYKYFGKPIFYGEFFLKIFAVFFGCLAVDLIRIYAIEKPMCRLFFDKAWKKFETWFRRIFIDEKVGAENE